MVAESVLQLKYTSHMTSIGKGIAITGTVRSDEPLAIAGTVKGEVFANDHEVTLEPEADVDGAVLARRIVIKGRYNGRLVAKETVHLMGGAKVKADVASPRFALDDGAIFNGKVDPAKTDAAFLVAEHRDKQ
jgi:cytoskeletal protein CcmA (bactofilin family)